MYSPNFYIEYILFHYMVKPRPKNIRKLVNTDKPRLPAKQNDEESFGQVIPIIEERYSLSTRATKGQAKIEKRWVTKNKTITVPIRYEEVYVNDKKIGAIESGDNKQHSSQNEAGDFASTFDKQIVDSERKGYAPQGKPVPLFDSENYDGKQESEKLLSVWGEEIIISKKMIKLEEIVIKKISITQKEKVAVDTIKEKVTMVYPDGSSKQIH